MGFFSKLAIVPQAISDFTPLPAGRHNVVVVDVIEMMQSQNVSIKDNKLVLDKTTREGFNRAFDQEILCILMKSATGDGFIIDRLSSKGWLESTDCDSDGVVLMDKAKERQYQFTPTEDGRYVDKDGIGVEHPEKSEICASLVHRFGTVCGVEFATLATGAKINIKVVDSAPYLSKKTGKMVTNTEVKRYYFYKEDGIEPDDEPTAPAPQATIAPAQAPLFGKR